MQRGYAAGTQERESSQNSRMNQQEFVENRQIEIRIRTPVSGVEMPFAGVFGIFYIKT